ncbi:MAG: hypothetical protein FWD93_05470 [Coriobacteriia bacterium]|nr:hypothetical protein [Coriobacteriia bacterium]
MNKSSNINWATFLLGGMWGSYNNFWAWVALWIPIFFACVYAFFVGLIFLGALAYSLMAIITVYLTLQGNHMLSNRVRSKELQAKAENKRRMTAEARQRKLAIYGVWHKLYYSYFLLSLASSIPATELQMSFDHTAILRTILILLIIDALALITVMLLSRIRGDEENVLYSGDGITADLIADTPMKYKPKSKGKISPTRAFLTRLKDGSLK